MAILASSVFVHLFFIHYSSFMYQSCSLEEICCTLAQFQHRKTNPFNQATLLAGGISHSGKEGGFAAWLVYNKNYNKEDISIKNYSTSEHNGRISFIFTHSFISATSLINKLIIFFKNVMPIAQCCLHLNHPSA